MWQHPWASFPSTGDFLFLFNHWFSVPLAQTVHSHYRRLCCAFSPSRPHIPSFCVPTTEVKSSCLQRQELLSQKLSLVGGLSPLSLHHTLLHQLLELEFGVTSSQLTTFLVILSKMQSGLPLECSVNFTCTLSTTHCL